MYTICIYNIVNYIYCLCCDVSLIEAARWEIRDRTQYRGGSGEGLSFTSYLRELCWHFSDWSSFVEFTLHYCQFFGWVEGLSCSWSILEMSPKMFLERRPGSYKHFHLAARRNWSNLSHKRWLYFFPAVSKQRQLCLTLTLRRWRAGALDALGFALSFSFCLTFTTFHFCVWKAAI